MALTGNCPCRMWLIDRRKAILGKRKNYCNGLHLRDDQQTIRIGRVHNVAGSTKRRPMRPSIGEVMWEYVRFSLALSIWA